MLKENVYSANVYIDSSISRSSTMGADIVISEEFQTGLVVGPCIMNFE